MKKVISTLLSIFIVGVGFAQTTYYWVAGTTEGNMSVAANWNTQQNGSGTSRSTIAATDILVVDGSNFGGATPTAPNSIATINVNAATTAQLKIINNANVIFDRTATNGTLTIANNTVGQDGLIIDATSSLLLTTVGSSTGAIYIDLPTSTATIAGKLKFVQGAATPSSNRLTARTVGAVVFTAGSSFEYDNTLGYPFGTVASGTPAASNSLNYAIVFQTGSSLINNSIYSPFGSNSTSTIVDFKQNSNYYVRNTMTTGSYTNAKTFGNVFLQNNATLTSDAAALNKIDNLTIDAGCSWVVGSSTSSQIPVLGNLVVNGTINGTVSPGTTILVMSGNGPQSITGSGSIAVSNFIVADNSNVTLNMDINVATATNIYGYINFNSNKILGTGTFTSRVNMVPSTGATQAGAGLTSGSFLVSVATGLALSGLQGLSISGAGIPAGTNIASYSSSGGQITLSQPATATSTGTTLTFSSNAATLATSNANGFDSTLGSVTVIGNKSYRAGTNFIINASTASPIGISSGATSAASAGNVTINANATTNTAVKVAGILTLTNAKLSIRPIDSVIINGGSLAGSFSNTNYIATLVNTGTGDKGMLAFTNITAATLLPIGSATNYMPVTLTPTTSDAFAVNVFEGITADATPAGTAFTAAQKAMVVNAVWTINRTSTNTDNCTINLNWPASLEGSAFAAFGNTIGIAGYTTAWGTVGGSGNNATNNATNSFNVFGGFGVGKLALNLPVKFTSIAASEQQGKIKVDWKVATETNTSNYVVERSGNGISFSEIGKLNAANSSAYSLTDNSPLNTNYYRIKAVDKNGSFDYSSIVQVKLKNDKASIAVYPNPVKGNQLNLQLSNLAKGNVELKLYNSLGQQLLAKTISYTGGNQTQTIQLPSSVTKGIYTLVIATADNMNMQQAVLVD